MVENDRKIEDSSKKLNVFFAESSSQNWLGGLNYYTNLFISLQTVENPNIVPYILKPGNSASNILYRYAEILPVKKNFVLLFYKEDSLPCSSQKF